MPPTKGTDGDVTLVQPTIRPSREPALQLLTLRDRKVASVVVSSSPEFDRFGGLSCYFLVR